MCGIAGIVGELPPDSAERLELALERLVHRGPDSAGTYAADGAMLGVRRLAIIDRQHGDQPIYNEDRRVAVVCNGEIVQLPARRPPGFGVGVTGCSPSRTSMSFPTDTKTRVSRRSPGGGNVRGGALGRRTSSAGSLARQGGQEAAVLPLGRDNLAFASELPSLMALLGEKPAIVPDAVALTSGTATSPSHGRSTTGCGASRQHRCWSSSRATSLRFAATGASSGLRSAGRGGGRRRLRPSNPSSSRRRSSA